MPQQVQIKHGSLLTIADKPFASGGEGDLYKILGSKEHENHVVKIYKPEKRTPERERKIEFLANNAPGLEVYSGHNPVIWVDQLIYQSGKFTGFTMPLARGEKLEMLCNPKLPPQLGSEWRKFNFADPKALELRQKICFNIAVAISQVHALESYVLIDMKPENIMIQSNGLVSIIDTDSVEVLQGGKVLFFPPVVTPEYTPPEYYRGVKPENDGAPKSWDCFSLSVIFYRLLCGIHPFVGSCNPPFENCNSYELKIENGLFPHGRNRNKYRVIPKEHENFRKLPATIQQLFLRCFDDGHHSPSLRPTVEEWCKELLPDAEMQQARLLPSFFNRFPVYAYSKEMPFPVITHIQLPNYTLPEFKRVSLLEELVNTFRFKSKKEQLKSLIKDKRKQFKSTLAGVKTLEDRLSQLLASYELQQQKILEFEQVEIERLRADFTARILITDGLVKERFELARRESQVLYQAFSAKIAGFNYDITSVKATLIDAGLAAMESEKTRHNDYVANRSLQKDRDIATAIQSPQKLVHYLIAPRAKEIFNSALPQLIASLQSCGIYTAADFTAVQKNGNVKKQNGDWVKIPGLGATRAALLDNWRKITETKEDQKIISAILDKSDADIRAATALFLQYEATWNATFTIHRQEYEQKRAAAEGRIKECQNEYAIKKEQLQSYLQEKTEFIKAASMNNAAAIVKETTEQQHVLYKQVYAKLKDNMDTHQQQLAAIREQQRTLEGELSAMYGEIRSLHTRFEGME